MDDRQVRLLMVLSAAVVAIGLVYWLVPERGADPAWDHAATVPVWQVDVDAVESLVVEQPDRPRLEVVRAGAGWRLVEPSDEPADRLRVDAALKALARIDLGVPIDGEPGDLGLGDPPRGRITVRHRGGRTETLDVGDAAPVGWQTYARTADGSVVAVAGHLDQDVVIDPYRFRDASVFRFDPTGVVRVELHSPAGVLDVVRHDDATWWLAGYGRADLTALDDLVLTLLDLRLDTFLDQAAPDGITEPKHRVVVGMADGSAVEARFGDDLPMGRLVQAASGAQGSILPERLAFLDQGPTDLGDVRAFPVTGQRVDRIEIVIDDRVAEMTGGDGAWTTRGLTGGQGAALFEALRRAGIDQFGSEAPELGASSGRVTIHEGAGRTRIVELGRVVDGARLAQDASGGRVYRVPEAEVAAIKERMP